MAIYVSTSFIEAKSNEHVVVKIAFKVLVKTTINLDSYQSRVIGIHTRITPVSLKPLHNLFSYIPTFMIARFILNHTVLLPFGVTVKWTAV